MEIPTERICELQYYVLGSEENELDSCSTVTNKELFRNDLPVPGGIMASAMGSTDWSFNCTTCGQTKELCPGHSGILHLRYPVKSPLFRDELLRWLKIICMTCGRPVIKKNVHAISKPRLLTEYTKLSKVSECEWCQAPHHNVTKAKHEQAVFYIETTDSHGNVRKEELFNHEILNILNKISDKTLQKLGKKSISHPRKFIITSIRVPSNVIRPDIRRIGGNRSSSNDVTTLLKNMVEINDRLPEEIPEHGRITSELRDMYFTLDMTYYELVRGSSSSANQVRLVTASNKAPGSIAERFPRKEGRIRQNLLGKRVRNMVRSVITGDDRMKVDELGLPMVNARTISMPETVRSYNRARLTLYFMNGRNLYPGCIGITKASNGHFYRIEPLKEREPDYVLQDGDIVHRDIITGDIVYFNRQPSLEFCSVTSMKVVVLENIKTITFNIAATKFFNADFNQLSESNSRLPGRLDSSPSGINSVKESLQSTCC